MIATNVLRGIIAENGLSQRKVAAHLGVSDKTFYEKMKRGVFNSDEIESMIRLLHIENPMVVFFPDCVNSN